MEQRFFNRLLHLINEKPKQGKRMIGLGANALWELWHRVAKQGKLNQEQKDFNRQLSQKRVYVEHVIRVLKIFRLAKEQFRLRANMYEEAIGGVCGLVRLRVQYA